MPMFRVYEFFSMRFFHLRVNLVVRSIFRANFARFFSSNGHFRVAMTRLEKVAGSIFDGNNVASWCFRIKLYLESKEVLKSMSRREI